MKIDDIVNLSEAPIGDYETIGDFERNSSIRDPRDRKLITNPKSIERVKSKFNNTEHNFNLYFVNMPKATHHKELGEVSEDWVRENLGDEVMDTVDMASNSINVIFTNNSGAERVPMTAWIMAHRIGHALVRKEGMNQFTNSGNPMASAFTDLIQHTAHILESGYGFQNSRLPMSIAQLTRADRSYQLLYKNFWQAICTFKSAREGSMRDWFEVNNELIAQYITTGHTTFNDLPKHFKNGKGYTRLNGDEHEVAEAEQFILQLDDMMDQEYSRVLSHATGRIYVM